VMAFGVLCFGCGFFTGFFVARNLFSKRNDQARCCPL
jgi:uncharacterized protein YneF (UPF0154 family)